MNHTLKTLSRNFQAVLEGVKTFEIRPNLDRAFAVNDLVELHEFEPVSAFGYTGRTLTKRITYVTGFEQREGFVVFGLADVDPRPNAAPVAPPFDAEQFAQALHDQLHYETISCNDAAMAPSDVLEAVKHAVANALSAPRAPR